MWCCQMRATTAPEVRQLKMEETPTVERLPSPIERIRQVEHDLRV
jgi:hypothetical protein